jgi:hypothetical protein
VCGRRAHGGIITLLLRQVASKGDRRYALHPIAESITFFDPQIDIAWLRQCAGIDAEIMAMPMNYNTFDSNLGTGQLGG